MPAPKKNRLTVETKNGKQIPLPTGITKTDLNRPKWSEKDGPNYDVGESGSFTLYYTDRFGWVLRTLFISRGTRGQPDRYYGRTLGRIPIPEGLRYSERAEREAGKLVRAGSGPHVLAEVTIYCSKKRTEKLQWLIDEFNAGMADAGDCRDRISTRRANSRRRRSEFGFFL